MGVGWSLGSLCCFAFRWQALREPLDVWAVIVNHVVFLHPSKPFLTRWIQFLWKPCIRRRGVWRTIRRCRCSIRQSTSIGFEVPVRSSERSMGPICLHQSTPSCPVISVPKTWVYSHGLVFGEWDSHWFHVLELSDWCTINREAEKQNQHNCIRS